MNPLAQHLAIQPPIPRRLLPIHPVDKRGQRHKPPARVGMPGKPTDNAFIESFNGKFRAECLNAHRFVSFTDAVEESEGWRRFYNEVRPHNAIGYKPPTSLMNASGAYGRLWSSIPKNPQPGGPISGARSPKRPSSRHAGQKVAGNVKAGALGAHINAVTRSMQPTG
jgi:hypothetical protein